MSGAPDSIRVIDFGRYLSGPLAALLLADQGAEAIRVDPADGPRWRHPANAVLQRDKRLTHLVLTFHAPGMVSEAVRRSMRAFARDIMPAIAAW